MPIVLLAPLDQAVIIAVVVRLMLNADFTLRVAILHFRTHKPEVDYLLAFLKKTAAEIEAGNP